MGRRKPKTLRRAEFSAPLAVTSAAVSNPVVAVATFAYWESPAAILIRFDADISASLDRTDLILENPLSGAPPFHPTSVSWDSASKMARFVLPALANGNYRARLLAQEVSRPPEYSLNGDVSLDFFVLTGDVNRDRAASFSDLVVIAQNYGRVGTDRLGGDLNGDGETSFDDLVAVYGKTTEPLPEPPAAAARPPFSIGPLAPPARAVRRA